MNVYGVVSKQDSNDSLLYPSLVQFVVYTWNYHDIYDIPICIEKSVYFRDDLSYYSCARFASLLPRVNLPLPFRVQCNSQRFIACSVFTYASCTWKDPYIIMPECTCNAYTHVFA